MGDDFRSSVFATLFLDTLTPSAARRVIGTAVFDALGLATGEREAVYEGVNELVRNRKARKLTPQPDHPKQLPNTVAGKAGCT